MFRKIRFVLVKSSQSKEGLDEKTPDQPKVEKPKNKHKFLGIFHSSSDPDLDSKQKTRKSFLRRKKNHEKENKESQDEAATEILTNHTEKLPVDLLPDGPFPDGLLPDGSIPDGQLPNGSLRDGEFPDNLLLESVAQDVFENASQKHSILDETSSPLDALKSMSISTIDSMHRVDRIDIEPFPPDGEAWQRARDVWEKNEIEETKGKEKEKRRKKEKKEHHDKKRDGKEEKDGKSRHRSKSREKDKEHSGKEQSDSKHRSKDKKRHEKHEHDEGKYEEKRSKEDKHKKHRSRSEKHGGGHKRDTSGGYDSDSERDSKHERKPDRKHRHKHEHRHRNDSDHDHTRDRSYDHARDRSYDHARDRSYDHARDHSYDHARDRSYDHARDSTPDRLRDRTLDRTRDGTLDRARDGTLDRAGAKEHKHHERSKHKDDKHTKKTDEHHKHSKHKEPKTEHQHTKERDKKYSPQTEDNKRIDLDKVWRDYESGKRYHSQEKDMKKIIDRLDGVERFRREERQRLSDRSHDRSSDTSHEVTHRSRSRERRRRSRSREKHKHESDQDSNHSSTWQYSLTRIEARQEQCKAEIDTARRSIEHRIRQLEMRFEKHYSSSERLPDQPREKSSAEQPPHYKTIIDQVADECREVTRTLEVRTEEMKSEIATVVREELTHLDEKLHSPSSPSSPGSFFGVRVVGNFRCEEATTIDPCKVTRDDEKPKLPASVTKVEPISSADESMVTVIEENSRTTRATPQDCAGAESLSPPSSRDSPVRVSQSGALDTLNEPSGPKHSVSSTCDSGISADHPMSPLHLRSPGNLDQLSLEDMEDEAHYDEEGHECNVTQEPLQEVYRRKIKETEARCQERALEEKEILYRRINELESMLLASRDTKGQYV